MENINLHVENNQKMVFPKGKIETDGKFLFHNTISFLSLIITGLLMNAN